MASLGARALRLVLRATRKIPGARTVASPHFVRRYRSFIGRAALLFGRVPRGLTRASVEDRAAGVRGEWLLLNADPNAATVVYYLARRRIRRRLARDVPNAHRRLLPSV